MGARIGWENVRCITGGSIYALLLCWCTLLYEEVIFQYFICYFGFADFCLGFLLPRGFELGLLFVLRYSVLRDTLVDSSRYMCTGYVYRVLWTFCPQLLAIMSQVGSLRSK